MLDRFEVDPVHSILEVVVREEFDGKTIVELDLRNHYGLTLMAISKENAMDKFEINPSPVTRLKAGNLMVVVGANTGIDKLPM